MFLTNRQNVDMFLTAFFANRQRSVDMFSFTNEGYELVVSFPRAMWKPYAFWRAEVKKPCKEQKTWN